MSSWEPLHKWCCSGGIRPWASALHKSHAASSGSQRSTLWLYEWNLQKILWFCTSTIFFYSSLGNEGARAALRGLVIKLGDCLGHLNATPNQIMNCRNNVTEQKTHKKKHFSQLSHKNSPKTLIVQTLVSRMSNRGEACQISPRKSEWRAQWCDQKGRTEPPFLKLLSTSDTD